MESTEDGAPEALNEQGDHPAAQEISLDTIARQHWEVRRRHYADKHWLVRHNEVFELNPFADALWRALGEGRSVGSATVMIVKQSGMPEEQAVAAALTTVSEFVRAGLVELEPGLQHPAGH